VSLQRVDIVIPPTLTAADCAARVWDVVVIGAGPSGCVTAKCLADLGLSVLLVESKSFPRSKVCGGCLNQSALAALRAAGLAAAIDALGPVPLRSFLLGAGRRSVELPLPGGIAVSRYAMDAALAQAAIDAGAAFLPETLAFVGEVVRTDGTSEPITREDDAPAEPPEGEGFPDGAARREPRPPASPGDCRSVRLEGSSGTLSITARVVVAASGLSGRSIRHLPGFASRESPTSKIGVEATLDDFPSDYQPGVIFIAAARHGYVGLTRVEDGRLNVAAAVDASLVREHGSPGEACLSILHEAGFPASDAMRNADWRGTARLTRSTSRQAAERLFVVGDAAGYVEPFTGEGMAWGMSGALELAPLAAQGACAWSDRLVEDWERRYRELVVRRQWTCRALALGLRQPRLVRLAVPVLQRVPWLARQIIRRLNRRTL
jgi:menaquinone-9 beta-reductase